MLEEGLLVTERRDRPLGDALPGRLDQVGDVVLAHLGDPQVEIIGPCCRFALLAKSDIELGIEDLQ